MKQKIRAGQPYLYRKNGLESEVYEIRFHEEVSGEHVNQALQDSLVRYPYFRVKFVEDKGDFYAVDNTEPLRAVHTDELIPLGGIQNHGHMISVTYYEQRVRVAFHHGLTDGRGIQNFIETLIYYYCRYRYHNMDLVTGIKTKEQQVSLQEYVDPCQSKYKIKRRVSKVKGLTKKAFSIPETAQSVGKLRRYEIRYSQSEFMKLCRKYHATPVILLSVLMSREIQSEHPDLRKTINSNFPVDIRNLVGAEETFQNCVKSVSFPYGTEEKMLSTQELCVYYRRLLSEQRNRDYCLKEQNRIIMLLNLLDHLHSYRKKQSLLKFMEDLKLNTYMISYIGQFNLGSNEQYVDSVHLYSSCTSGIVINMTCECGYFNLDFIQDFQSNRYLHALLKQFQMEGLEVQVSDEIKFSTPCDILMRDMQTSDAVTQNMQACDGVKQKMRIREVVRPE